MQVSKEELLHIADLAQLELEESEVNNYLENLQDILNFANIVNNAPVDDLDITIGANEAKNVFRKDEVKMFENTEMLLQNAPAKEMNMFKVPKVVSHLGTVLQCHTKKMTFYKKEPTPTEKYRHQLKKGG